MLKLPQPFPCFKVNRFEGKTDKQDQIVFWSPNTTVGFFTCGIFHFGRVNLFYVSFCCFFFGTKSILTVIFHSNFFFLESTYKRHFRDILALFVFDVETFRLLSYFSDDFQKWWHILRCVLIPPKALKNCLNECKIERYLGS